MPDTAPYGDLSILEQEVLRAEQGVRTASGSGYICGACMGKRHETRST